MNYEKTKNFLKALGLRLVLEHKMSLKSMHARLKAAFSKHENHSVDTNKKSPGPSYCGASEEFNNGKKGADKDFGGRSSKRVGKHRRNRSGKSKRCGGRDSGALRHPNC